MTLEIFTFADEGYVPAVVALINSLRAHGVTAPIHVGSPEPLSLAAYAHADPGVQLHVLGPSPWWPGNRKAELLLRHPAARFLFLDADMVVTTGALLPRVESWLEAAPVACVEALVPAVDHRRHRWAQRLARPARPQQWPVHYFNSGLLGGIWERDRPLIAAWDEAMRAVLTPPAPIFADPDFPMPDQDVLNAVLQDWQPQPIGISAPDVWSAVAPLHPFLHVGSFQQPAVLHCTGADKPWKATAVPARGPHAYDLAWYQHVVRAPHPLQLPLTLSPLLRAWFEQQPSGRMATRATRLWRRFSG